jgi:hypothetical protein
MILSLSSRILVRVNARQAVPARPVPPGRPGRPRGPRSPSQTSSATSASSAPPGRGTLRRPPAPRPGLMNGCLVAAGIGLGATTALAITGETGSKLSAAGGVATFAVWSAVWAATAGLVLTYRVGLPVLRSARHQLRVTEVRPEGPGVVSVICRGRRLDRAGRGHTPRGVRHLMRRQTGEQT